MKLLRIDSSIQGESSASRILTTAIVEQLRSAVPDLEVLARDLAGSPLPHLTLAHLPQAHPLAIKERTHEVDDVVRIASQEALEEFLQSDVIVIGAPMYNFTIPSQLKAWIDRIVIPGQTFHYKDGRAQGLMGDKRVIIALTRGGVFEPSAPSAAFEYASRYLLAILSFIGIHAPDVIVAEGLQLGTDQRAIGLEQAHAHIDAAVSKLAAA